MPCEGQWGKVGVGLSVIGNVTVKVWGFRPYLSILSKLLRITALISMVPPCKCLSYKGLSPIQGIPRQSKEPPGEGGGQARWPGAMYIPSFLGP